LVKANQKELNMQHAVHNRATIRVADRTDVRGRVTADEVNLHRFHNRIRKVCALLAATFILPALPSAQGKDPLAELQAQVASLETTVTALQSQVNSLQTQLSAVQSNKALKLGPFVDVDPNPETGVAGPNIIFKGANIHILSGSGATDDNINNGGTMTGLGNLIIGYDELLTSPKLQIANRGGSHNLVIGRFHNFTPSAFGGLVAGEENLISAEAASISGGEGNRASAVAASVSGGVANTASGKDSSVSGGLGNTASNQSASVSGGQGNRANGLEASVLCGDGNIASGRRSVVIGGANVTANNLDSIAPQNLSLFP
jgi:hypothetical protein